MVNCFYDAYTVLNKVYKDKAFFKQALNNTPIEEKNRALTVKLCYGVLDKDIELSYTISYFTEKSPKSAIKTILKISMYAIKYLNKHDYAVINSAVELTKKMGKGGAAGFVNAFLRRFTKEPVMFPDNILERFSVKYSYPLFAVKKLVKDYGEELAEKIIATESDWGGVVFYDTDGEEYLKNHGEEYEKTPFYNVFAVKGFKRNSDYDKGLYTFQAIGSVAICDGVESGKTLLDCCAAPGGKTVRLSHRFESVTAFDVYEHRVELIKDYARRMKRENITAKVFDAKNYNDGMKDSFDAVLCDAPCSGLGVVSDNPDIKINRTEENVEELKKEQYAILDTVKNYVKVGGYLYYSTCSVLKEENEGTVLKFLANNSNFTEIKTDSKQKNYPMKVGVSFLPQDTYGNGFYFCKLKREK